MNAINKSLTHLVGGSLVSLADFALAMWQQGHGLAWRGHADSIIIPSSQVQRTQVRNPLNNMLSHWPSPPASRTPSFLWLVPPFGTRSLSLATKLPDSAPSYRYIRPTCSLQQIHSHAITLTITIASYYHYCYSTIINSSNPSLAPAYEGFLWPPCPTAPPNYHAQSWQEPDSRTLPVRFIYEDRVQSDG